VTDSQLSRRCSTSQAENAASPRTASTASLADGTAGVVLDADDDPGGDRLGRGSRLDVQERIPMSRPRYGKVHRDLVVTGRGG
jgi:hypothetical protein